ncbi:MAG: DUF4442 domain-containing protein [Planctomycetota bacterium]|jgi:acyl-coenzyme A thioesterase PaaI-like protein
MFRGKPPRRLLRWLVRHLSWYPPYLGAGVRVQADLENDTYRVAMRLRWFNRNVHGTHFGGSLFSMCDPFFALIVAHRLGHDYEVWMKSASIDYVRPGRGTVSAVFHVPAERIEEIRHEVDAMGRADPGFDVNVVDEEGQVVVRVSQVVHVRRAAEAAATGR